MDIKIGPPKNIDSVLRHLKNLPYGTKREAVIGVAEHLVGDEQHGFSHDDPYRQTTRRKVYGQTFFSDAQRRKVMAMINNGEIVIGQRQNSPTEASGQYGYKLIRGGYGAVITNPSPGAYWTRIWGGWKNWRSATQVIHDNLAGAVRHALARVNRILREKGK